ncbi:OmpH family outer membrane protein [Candidatus Pelagibacter sp.]|nr:OmpH family outer membrane protein [Candidatus Pelagibacter sp.]
MKFFVILISLIFFIINPIKAIDLKIVYIDTDKILNESKAGIDIKKQLDSINKKNISKFNKIEKELVEEEKKISQKKNILSKEELEKKIKVLQEKVIKFNNDVKNNKNDLLKKNKNATEKILKSLNSILSDYASKNSIYIILQKKHIVIGRGDLDITSEILNIVNGKVKNIELQ